MARKPEGDSGGKHRKLQDFMYRAARFLALKTFFGRFNISADPEPDLPAPYVVIANHVTDYDFAFIASVFRTPLSFVVGRGLMQNSLVRLILVRGFGCIGKLKGAKDARTTLAMLRRLRAGRNVCLFAEGNTTFSGRTGAFPAATGSLLKSVNAGLVTCRIEGGYFALPRWGKGIRKGRTACRVVRVYRKEELAGMGADEINAALQRDIQEDAYLRQAKEAVRFSGRNKAWGIGHALYLCPGCQSFNTILGEGDEIRCEACGKSARYEETGRINGDFGIETITDWVVWQKGQLEEMISRPGDSTGISDPNQSLCLQDEEGQLESLANGEMRMDRNALSVGGFSIDCERISGFEIYRKNVIQFTADDGRHYQTGGPEGFNALKYRDLYEILREKGE